MKIRTEEITSGEDEIVIRYHQLTKLQAGFQKGGKENE